ncbi:hypothetical protein CDQ84_19030 [Clostridium thermosuccinogenes]|jgi:hypothetical protein|uniref:Uncharacterized protein n=1 Tax=Clostridium thermosuccinogenes TaxID=84032 RepID=A0A2K2EZE1_9CLOT|nr:hypothetical protein [Pseudoclostridium thermosuccinogenes]AUS95277.1 hypothetical protein CDO33_01735 [Pseudoclostridium thermosuccinogenes]PNT90662.1 hypothetical protein CDQ83_18685 [Pseudoclostridium thermosuccinogenes]PNT91740.1 hypothetical protein CDQ85_19000 [Pseudoclostridium thermosuccinogenes]PNT91905.1 hypothetical protein CDQ84_19030 [Pseudoclostridium thermosuccinogenes]
MYKIGDTVKIMGNSIGKSNIEMLARVIGVRESRVFTKQLADGSKGYCQMLTIQLLDSGEIVEVADVFVIKA